MEINNIRKNKKGVTQYLITIVLAVVTFFILLGFFISSSDYITSESEDLACRAWVSTLASAGDGFTLVIGEALKELNYRCKKENVEIESEKREEIYEEIAQRINKCWYRFGEGEKNFMSKFDTEGEWCFTCAKLSFEEQGQLFDYYSEDGDSYIEWASDEQNYITLNNGTRISHIDYATYKYSTLTEDEWEENKDLLDELYVLKKDFEGIDEFQELISHFSKQNTELFNQATKKINTNEDLYVVYRYDVVDEEGLDGIIDDLETSVIAGTVTSLAISQAGGLVAGILCPPCGVGVVATSMIKKFNTLRGSIKTANRLNKVSNIVRKLSTAVKITGKKYPVSIGAGVGAAAGASYLVSNFNDNHIQYVDLLSKEQYYRTCGTEPKGSSGSIFG